MIDQVAAAYEATYGKRLALRRRRRQLPQRDGGTALVFELAPVTVFGFSKGEPCSQTRWRFDHA